MLKWVLFCLTLFLSQNLSSSEILAWRAVIGDNETRLYQTLYDFGINEYQCANYGTAKEILEKLCLKTDEFPTAYYYIAQVYRRIRVYKDDVLYRRNLLNFVTSTKKKDIYLLQEAYYELTCLETDPDVAHHYAEKAQKIRRNRTALLAMKEAYSKMYRKTRDIKFARLTRKYENEINLQLETTNFTLPR